MSGVTNEEVLKMASVKCKSCRGSGQVLKWIYTDPNTQQRVAVVCGCATRRFLKKHRERIIIQPDGGMTWKDPIDAIRATGATVELHGPEAA